MNRSEALRTLGLDDSATPEDIKTAYRESVQILHPDKFSGNKKLQDRATEQFKNLQEAYDYLLSGKGAKSSGSKTTSTEAGSQSYSTVEAKIAGIQAARTQLVKQRDVAMDERRTGVGMAAIGAIIALFAGRRPYGLFGVAAAIASAVAIWGVVQVISSQKSINTLDEHIKKLREEERKLSQE